MRPETYVMLIEARRNLQDATNKMLAALGNDPADPEPTEHAEGEPGSRVTAETVQVGDVLNWDSDNITILHRAQCAQSSYISYVYDD